jgi:fermentation-respiration switch protein FrsA (DUF1100 family)
MNFHPLNDLELIAPRPLLFITGDQAHSREFCEEAYRLATGLKEHSWVPCAGHVHLYDRAGLIAFDKLTDFFRTQL